MKPRSPRRIPLTTKYAAWVAAATPTGVDKSTFRAPTTRIHAKMAGATNWCNACKYRPSGQLSACCPLTRGLSSHAGPGRACKALVRICQPVKRDRLVEHPLHIEATAHEGRAGRGRARAETHI